jgi:AraC-like DNA-binding protein
MIGVHFKAGGAAAFLGLSAEELRDQVVDLEAIWGRCVWLWRDRLLAAPGPRAKFRLLEQFLLTLLQRRPSDLQRQRRVQWALGRFLNQPDTVTIRSVVEELGISHKHFIDQFRREVGLTPKLFCRIQRFQKVLSTIQAQQTVQWADIASSCGYFDQAHFVYDFHAFAGLNPTRYLSYQADYPNFVAVK